MKLTLSLDQKYEFYERSVQFPDGEVDFMRAEFKRYFGRFPLTMREDFCGTAAISCNWVTKHKDAEAFGVDLDPEPIEMGKKRHFARLNSKQQARMHYLQENVLKNSAPKTDVVCAFNFSYWIFKQRKDLVKYFKGVKKSLNKQGIFFLDLFGGPESQKLITDQKKLEGLTYYWECQQFNPLTHDCTFAIHFKDAKGKKHLNVFTYDWRFWTLPELKDILIEAGFSKVMTYWEDDDGEGGGSGDYYPADDAENCDAWVSYIAAIN